jgi:prepilin-type N-terminal cleavage/methylation domain-containing protein
MTAKIKTAKPTKTTKLVGLKQKGFSLMELIIVLVISSVLLSVVLYKVDTSLANLGVDEGVSKLMSAMAEARNQSLLGIENPMGRTFNIDILSRSGLVVSSTNPKQDFKSSCESTYKTNIFDVNPTCPNQLTFCASGKTFCYTPATSFTFKRFEGRLPNSHVIFISSPNRHIAILLEKTGYFSIAEFIGTEWQLRTETRDLYINNNNNDVRPTKE